MNPSEPKSESAKGVRTHKNLQDYEKDLKMDMCGRRIPHMVDARIYLYIAYNSASYVIIDIRYDEWGICCFWLGGVTHDDESERVMPPYIQVRCKKLVTGRGNAEAKGFSFQWHLYDVVLPSTRWRVINL